MKSKKTCKYYDTCGSGGNCHKCGGYVNAKRAKCAEAGREVRRIQREYLREVAGEMKNALEALLSGVAPTFWTDHRDVEAARKALEKARRLGL